MKKIDLKKRMAELKTRQRASKAYSTMERNQKPRRWIHLKLSSQRNKRIKNEKKVKQFCYEKDLWDTIKGNNMYGMTSKEIVCTLWESQRRKEQRV